MLKYSVADPRAVGFKFWVNQINRASSSVVAVGASGWCAVYIFDKLSTVKFRTWRSFLSEKINFFICIDLNKIWVEGGDPFEMGNFSLQVTFLICIVQSI